MILLRRPVIGALLLTAALSPSMSAQAARHKKHPAPKIATPAAQTLGTADAWTAYLTEDKTGRVCYLVGQPRRSEPAGFPRKPAMAMVTHRPVENVANVVSLVEGYPLKEGSDVMLDVDGHKFELFTNGDSAWARTSELDGTIVATLAKGKEARVKGLPQRGPATTDIYSLAGFSKALALIDKACGIKRESEPSPSQPSKHHRPAKHHRPEKHRRAHHRATKQR
jgi:Invasion associated locus B (IalB) protein